MKIYNSHVHTNVSDDCFVSCDEMAAAAISAGASGISFTDHCIGSSFISRNAYTAAKASAKCARLAAEKYQGHIEIFAGIEFEEMRCCPEYAQRIIDTTDFDIILASVHRVLNYSVQKPISQVNFSEFPEAELHKYVSLYFDAVLETVQKCDFDSLAHLTVILRYICVKYGRTLDITPHLAAIDQILNVLIRRSKALEINTSEIKTIGLMPDDNIIRRYRRLGGSLVTIGTDAHTADRITYGFDEAISVLKKCGFDYYVYYKQRKFYKEYI